MPGTDIIGAFKELNISGVVYKVNRLVDAEMTVSKHGTHRAMIVLDVSPIGFYPREAQKKTDARE